MSAPSSPAGEKRLPFRSEARARHAGSASIPGTPGALPARSFGWMWALLALLVLGSAWTWTRTVPVSAEVPAEPMPQAGAAAFRVRLAPAVAAGIAPGHGVVVHCRGAERPLRLPARVRRLTETSIEPGTWQIELDLAGESCKGAPLAMEVEVGRRSLAALAVELYRNTGRP